MASYKEMRALIKALQRASEGLEPLPVVDVMVALNLNANFKFMN